MVVAGHYDPSIAAFFAVGGTTISLVAGLLFALWAKPPALGTAALGGLIAGGACALIGITVSFLLGDVPAPVLAFGTVSSAVTGTIGGAVGRLIASRRVAGA
jgi:hypothetical protein